MPGEELELVSAFISYWLLWKKIKSASGGCVVNEPPDDGSTSLKAPFFREKIGVDFKLLGTGTSSELIVLRGLYSDIAVMIRKLT